MVSLSSGLQQFVSNVYLVTPGSTGTSATSENGLSQLSASANQLQSTAKSQVSTSSSSSARLAEDTYTSSTQSQTVQSSSTSSKASSSSTVSSASASQGSQGDTVTLASLIQNQTISGSSAVRQVLETAIEPYENGQTVKEDWSTLADKVNSGDYAGAQTALTNYTTALSGSDVDMSHIQSELTALGSALQAGSATDVQTAFTALNRNAPETVLGVENYVFTGDVQEYTSAVEQAAPAMTDELEKVGYTAGNAAVETNAIILGTVADAVASGSVSGQPQVDQDITDLAKATTNSNLDDQGSTTDRNLMSSIIASMARANSGTAMESTLTQLDSKYGTAAQGASADNADKNSDGSIYA
jgi:hypothetical protein